jgi:tetratricopeptide (TPR) repeat protein
MMCSVVLPIFSLATEDDEMSQDVREGIVCFAKGDLDGAIAKFTSAIEVDPKDHLAYYQRAKLYEFRNETEKAISDYGLLINSDAKPLLVNFSYYYRAVLYQQKNLLEEAIADYTKIIDINFDKIAILANAYNNRGLAYDKKGRFDSAVSDFGKAIELMPNLVNAHYNRGISYANMGVAGYSLALANFLKELGINPRSFGAQHYRWAIIFLNQKDYYKSWYEVLTLMRGGERVSMRLMADLKKLKEGQRFQFIGRVSN